MTLMRLIPTILKLSLVAILFSVMSCNRHKNGRGLLAAEQVYDIISDSVKINEYVVLDTRSRMDYVRGHLVSAIWLSPDSIGSKLEILSGEKRPFIIYDSASVENAKAAQLFSKFGITNYFEMEGGFSGWMKKGFPAAIQLVRNTSNKVDFEKKDISATEVRALLEKENASYVLIDIRSYSAYAEAHIEKAISIPYVPINEFVVKIEEQNFSRNQPIILYSDAYSDIGEKACDVMLRNDFSKVYLMKGGIEQWFTQKYPMVWQ
jgi:rhodanese-related sulfurtransferase